VDKHWLIPPHVLGMLLISSGRWKVMTFLASSNIFRRKTGLVFRISIRGKGQGRSSNGGEQIGMRCTF